MEGVAPPHCSACSFRKTLERTKINANKCNTACIPDAFIGIYLHVFALLSHAAFIYMCLPSHLFACPCVLSFVFLFALQLISHL